jgi:hypothetical protein
MAKPKLGMDGKALVFVTGHPRPSVAKLTAPYIRIHPDGTPMLAASTSDTVAACMARWEAKQEADAQADGKKGGGRTKEAKADGA